MHFGSCYEVIVISNGEENGCGCVFVENVSET